MPALQATAAETAKTQLWHPRYWPTWIGAGLASLLCFLPWKWRDNIAALLARRFYRPDTKQIHIARINLQRCFPQWSNTRIEEFLQDYFTRYIQVLAQSPGLWWYTRQQLWGRLDVRGLAYLQNLRAEGRPIVLLFNHALTIDFAAQGLATQLPLRGIYKPFDNAVIDYLFRCSRERFGAELVSRGQALRSTLRALQQGSMLVYLCDEDFGAEGSVFAPFYQSQKATLTMLPRLVRHSDARVIPVFSHYDLDTGKIIVEVLPEFSGYPSDSEQDNAVQLNQALQAMIAICPEQYLWKLRLFRTQPDGAASPYQ